MKKLSLLAIIAMFVMFGGFSSLMAGDEYCDTTKVTKSTNPDLMKTIAIKVKHDTAIPEPGKSITEGLKESQIDSSKLLLTKEGGDAAPIKLVEQEGNNYAPIKLAEQDGSDYVPVKVSASDSTNPDLVSAEPVIGSDKTHLSIKEEMDSKTVISRKYVLEKHSGGTFVMRKIGGSGGAPKISEEGSI